eukprot:gb/GEZN01006104.1/.p1 GENE.gb/GEZN01006104.1/~~gb/GEZN01006104.1/.p1  ORF type:complete len:387 (+),score=34.73 gb/GEZN01006104.1/:25-1185(+)
MVPLVLWSQSRKTVSLKLPALDIDSVSVAVVGDGETGLSISFSTKPVLGQSPQKHATDLKLFAPCSVKAAAWKTKPGGLFIDIPKLENQEVCIWPRLTHSKEKNPKIKIDWDTWTDLEGESEDAGEKVGTKQSMPSVDELLEKYPGFKPPPSGSPGGKTRAASSPAGMWGVDWASLSAKEKWVAAFNLVVLSCWAAVGVRFLLIFAQASIRLDPNVIPDRAYNVMGPLIIAAQLIAILEPVHALLGLSRGSWLPALFLHIGRNVVLYFIFEYTTTRKDWGVAVVFLVWCVGEIIRYPFYFLIITKKYAPTRLTWARYSFPLVLLPIGFVSELRVLYVASSLLTRESQLLLLGFSLVAYLVGAPFIYISVLRLQRKRCSKKLIKKWE